MRRVYWLANSAIALTEGLLRRLSASPHRDNFVLKGAMLFTVWLDDPFRPTQDLDLLGYGDSAVDTIAGTFRQICAQDADNDGLIFEVRNLVAHAIREDQPYGGLPVRTKASLGKIQIPIQVDVGFGDVITPQSVPVEFPALLTRTIASSVKTHFSHFSTYDTPWTAMGQQSMDNSLTILALRTQHSPGTQLSVVNGLMEIEETVPLVGGAGFEPATR